MTMGVSRRVLMASLLGVLFCTEVSRAAKHDNRHAFEVLCNLYKLGEASVKIPDTALPEHIRGDLIKLNMTTADDTWYDLFEANDPGNWVEAKKLDKFKAFEKETGWPEMYPEWLKAKKELLEDAKGEKEFLRPPASHQRKSAHFQIHRLWQRFLKEEGERKDLNTTLKNLEDEVKKKFNGARFGEEDATAVTTASFDGKGAQARSGYACGNTGDKHTGTSLANDLVCICTVATGTGTGADKLCDNGYTPGAAKEWNTNAAAIIAEVPLIVKQCPGNPDNFKVTAGTIRGNLTKFWGALGKNTASSPLSSAFALGGGSSGKTDGNCQGAGGTPTQICVNYAANLVGSGSVAPAPIPWLKKLEDAAAKLDEVAAEEKKIHALNARAESLRDAAWAAYGQALLPDPTGAAPETTANLSKTDRPTAAVPGGSGKIEERNGATTPRFVLLWTLLI